jgi:hypothetical protein
MTRVYRGLEEVQKAAVAGVDNEELNRQLWSHLDTTKDAVFGNAVQQTGWDTTEDYNDSTLQENDYIRLGAAIGAVDTGEIAVVFRGCMSVPPKLVVYQEQVEEKEEEAEMQHVSYIPSEDDREKLLEFF